MCRQFAFVNTEWIDSDKGMASCITTLNALWEDTQKDGFGYCCVAPDGTLHGERHLIPKAFRYPGSFSRVFTEKLIARKLRPRLLWSRIGSGEPVRGGPMVVHGRNATGKVTIESVHPFTKQGWVLTHNGVVRSAGRGTVLWPNKSGCDSEDLLNCFVHGSGFEEVSDQLAGWAAFFLITPKRRRLWAARCDTAPLYLSWFGTAERGSYALASEGEHLVKVAKAMKVTFTSPIPVDPETALFFYGKGKNDVTVRKWKGMAISYTTTATTGTGSTAWTGGSAYGVTTYGPPKTANSTQGTGAATTPAPKPAAQAELPLTEAELKARAFGTTTTNPSTGLVGGIVDDYNYAE